MPASPTSVLGRLLAAAKAERHSCQVEFARMSAVGQRGEATFALGRLRAAEALVAKLEAYAVGPKVGFPDIAILLVTLLHATATEAADLAQ